jgi:PhzF family phenazine biosynthesis protein
MTGGELYRIAAFTETPEGGNPAGVWIGATLPDAQSMQKIASDVGYSETIFLAPSIGNERKVRYYSPLAEVDFCGHATIAAGAVLGSRSGEATYLLSTRAGEVPLTVRLIAGKIESSLTSVEPRHTPAGDALLDAVLATLGWGREVLDPGIPPARAFAGVWHLVIALADSDLLASMRYDFEQLQQIMLREKLTTIQLVWRESQYLFHARNPFPVGGVVEDPATGAAAAALGGFLRDAGLLEAPATIVIRQGEAMGRPSRLTVEIPQSGGIIVSGRAVAIGPSSR